MTAIHMCSNFGGFRLSPPFSFTRAEISSECQWVLKFPLEQRLAQCVYGPRGDYPSFLRNLHFFFCTCHNFPPLSSVQIIIIPACCLLCVL